jgi:hypothetical protein
MEIIDVLGDGVPNFVSHHKFRYGLGPRLARRSQNNPSGTAEIRGTGEQHRVERQPQQVAS